MGGRAKMLRGLVAWSAVSVLILVFLTSVTWFWNLAPLVFIENWRFIPHQENYWVIPGNSSSWIPSTNYSDDVYIDLMKFRQQLRLQNKQCKNLTEDLFTMFKSRPSKKTKFTAEIDSERIKLAFKCGGVLYPEYLTTPPREELYPFEAFYLSDPPLWDASTVACHKHSTISLYGSNKTFFVGDAVSVVIKMFDRKGRPRSKGGDRLKVWLKDEKFQHSISANITDFNNGTYLATSVLPWAGTVRVKAILRQSREFFRALAYVHRTIKSTMPFGGAYTNSQANETVPCSAIPLVPGYQKSELCNLTLINGSPWYCGGPSKQELNCSDYHFVIFWRNRTPMPITPAEETLLKQPINQMNFLSGKIILNVEATKSGLTRMPDPNVPCNKVSPRSTWHQSEPTGYFYHKVWKPFLCFVPDNPENVDESCLRNVHMFFYGDSNSKYFYSRTVSKVQCHQVEQMGLKRQPKTCENKARNITLQMACHSSPFNTESNQFVIASFLHPPQKQFGSVPSEGRYIISFNHYLHFAAHHISVYERALTAVRDEIVKLLKRNPHGQIILRGPHVAERAPYVYYVSDVWAQYVTTIQKETFRDLQDRIIYFPTWDITVASGDTDIHPRFIQQSTMKKEPEVLTDASLTVLARGIGKEQLKGLELAMYLNIPTTAIINIINGAATSFLTDEGSENDRMAVTSECLLLWKKMTRESKTRDRVRDLERALKEIGKTELAELFVEYHQSGQEISDSIFQ